MATTPKILTTYVYPPIPIRQFDWQAHYDGEEDEQMDVGRGATELEAIVDLIENCPRPDVWCTKDSVPLTVNGLSDEELGMSAAIFRTVGG